MRSKFSDAGIVICTATQAPLDSNERLASFGPHFGQEALDEFLRRLSAAGLAYFDDFIEFSGVWPEWCRFKAYSPD